MMCECRGNITLHISKCKRLLKLVAQFAVTVSHAHVSLFVLNKSEAEFLFELTNEVFYSFLIVQNNAIFLRKLTK